MTESIRYRFFFIALLLFPAQLFGQIPEGMSKRAYHLVNHFDKYHLRPRTRDAAFGQDVHTELLRLVDEEKMLFEQRDIAVLQGLADSIGIDLLMEKTRYAERFLEIYHQRVQETDQFLKNLLHTMPDIQSGSGTWKEHTGYAADLAERTRRWKELLLYNLQYDVITSLDSEGSMDDATVKRTAEKAWESVRKEFGDHLASLLRMDKNFELFYLNAIALAYDPHSSYFNDEMNEDFSEELTSTQFVFGITYGTTLDGQLEITEIMPGSSAWFSEDIQEGDKLISITSSSGQYVDVRNASPEQVSEFFSALTSDSITILLYHDGEEKKAELVRSRVYSDNDIIKTALLEGERRIGYISLPDFYTSWTDTSMLGCANDVAKSILKLKKAGIEGLILDLRHNGGGSLWEAVNLVGIFIDFGPVLLIEEPDGQVTSMKDFNRGSMYNGPLMILINGESASASEVVAGTLQDYHRALIVGQTSYGKATGQDIMSLDPRVELLGAWIEEDPSWGYAKTTDIGLYRLNKSSAQRAGVTPDVVIPSFARTEMEREADLPHVIELDSVEKTIYLTAGGKIPADEVGKWYAAQDHGLDSLLNILEQLDRLHQQLAQNLNLKKGMELFREIEKLREDFSAMRDRHSFVYKAVSFQFDPNLLRMSPYLERYNTQFLERLGKDLELNESYKIMQEFILQQQ